MYIDIDIHHGDGVEKAFCSSNRVLTLSFHQYDDKELFFPGTGNFSDVGFKEGKYFKVNVPLKPGCDDEAFIELFDTIFTRAFNIFKPNVI